MKFKLNEEDFVHDTNLNVDQLLNLQEIDYKKLAISVKINGEFISMKTYETTNINENDDVWIIQFFPGG